MPIRHFLTAVPTTFLLAGQAMAHPGHLADDGHGHAHYIALAALAGIVVVAFAAWRRSRRIRREAARDRTA